MAGAGASAVRNVFVYGSLLAPEVLSVLLRRVPPSAPAVVHDLRRCSLAGRVYPAVVPAKGSQVRGKVLFDLTDAELGVLDEFEDVEYVKEVVEPVVLDAKGLHAPILDQVRASVYVWSNPEDRDLLGEWDYERWRAECLVEYTRMCSSFMAELGAQ